MMVFGLMLNVVESSGTTPVVFVEAEAWGSIPHSPTPFPIGVPLAMAGLCPVLLYWRIL